MRYPLAVLSMLCCLAAPAVKAQVSVGIGIEVPGIQIGINMPVYPELVPVPGYPVYYDPRADSNYFFYDGLYFVYQGDEWYASSWYDGPWWVVEPVDVPLFILRVPVRYYRRPPVYFSTWGRDEPPRWGEHWGPRWEERRRGWDHWDRQSVPPPAPLPTYQRQYSGDRYPRAPDQQVAIRTQNYHYQPHDAVVQRQVAQEAHAKVERSEARPQGRPQSGHENGGGHAPREQPQAGPPEHQALQQRSAHPQPPQPSSSRQVSQARAAPGHTEGAGHSMGHPSRVAPQAGPPEHQTRQPGSVHPQPSQPSSSRPPQASRQVFQARATPGHTEGSGHSMGQPPRAAPQAGPPEHQALQQRSVHPQPPQPSSSRPPQAPRQVAQARAAPAQPEGAGHSTAPTVAHAPRDKGHPPE